jgi:hypothetical protein
VRSCGKSGRYAHGPALADVSGSLIGHAPEGAPAKPSSSALGLAFHCHAPPATGGGRRRLPARRCRHASSTASAASAFLMLTFISSSLSVAPWTSPTCGCQSRHIRWQPRKRPPGCCMVPDPSRMHDGKCQNPGRLHACCFVLPLSALTRRSRCGERHTPMPPAGAPSPRRGAPEVLLRARPHQPAPRLPRAPLQRAGRRRLTTVRLEVLAHHPTRPSFWPCATACARKNTPCQQPRHERRVMRAVGPTLRPQPGPQGAAAARRGCCVAAGRERVRARRGRGTAR